MKRTQEESFLFTRTVPVTHEVDIAVVGGGIAGTCAACAAALEKKTVLLVEKFAMLGGSGTVGGVTGFCGETKGQGRVFDMLLTGLKKFNAIEPYRPGKGGKYDHEIFAIVLQEVALQCKVNLLFHVSFADVGIDKNEHGTMITHLIINGKSGLQAIKAKMVIDCSGEADVVHRAGLGTMKGRESDGMQLPMSLNFFLRKGKRGKKFIKVPPCFFPWKPYKKRWDLPMTSFRPFGSKGKAVKIKIPVFDATTTEGLSSAEVEGHRKMMQVLEYFQSKEFKTWELSHCSQVIGIREGRRARGDYILTVDDVRAGREFEDAIAVGCYQLDAHEPGDDKRTYILPKDQLKVPPYHIPLRSLIPEGSSNLLVAGRNLSADQLAMSSARVMTTCAMMGEAAGTTASRCIDENTTPLDIARKSPGLIRSIMEAGGAILDRSFYPA